MAQVLIADDNPQIADVLKEYLKQEGHIAHIARDGEEALRMFERIRPDALLLDVMMPRLDGFAVCREIRKQSMVPIIMITARGEDFEKIMGLDIGADDYIVKPFSPSEVMARLRAVLRRLEAGCAAPVGISARLTDASQPVVEVIAEVYALDGSRTVRVERRIPRPDLADAAGRDRFAALVVDDLMAAGAGDLADLGSRGPGGAGRP